MPQPSNVSNLRYRSFRALHWAMVIIFVLLAMVTEYALDAVTDAEQRTLVRNLHVTIGLIFALFLVFRWYWYARNHTVRATFKSTWQRRLAFANFIILHSLMSLLVISGVIRLLTDGDEVSLFNYLPAISLAAFENPDVKYYAQEAHLYLRNTAYLFLTLHIFGAIDFYRNLHRQVQGSTNPATS